VSRTKSTVKMRVRQPAQRKGTIEVGAGTGST